jgi:hypothetical protein
MRSLDMRTSGLKMSEHTPCRMVASGGFLLGCGVLLRERFGLFASGIRVMPSCFMRRRSVFWPLRRHPRYDVPLHASPLCGAAPTFLCRRKEK